jgi:hypothetical protein
MNRLVLGVAAIVAGLSGCATPARYIERSGDNGVVAIPANTDAFPSYNRSEAIALIHKHVGPNFEIVEEREVATGKRTLNDQQVNNEQTWNTANPLLPANKQTVQNTTTTQDVTEWRIAYRKKASTSIGSGTLGSSVTPAGGVQSRMPVGAVSPPVQPAGGIVPPVGPNSGVVPAGPIAPVGVPTSSVVPAGPLAPTGGPGVYGSVSAVVGKTN